MKMKEKIKQIVSKIIDWFLTEPKRLVRLIVLTICSFVVFFQLRDCVLKLMHPPVSTHSHFDLNQTMYYPAVTFCREPAFKLEVMKVSKSILMTNFCFEVKLFAQRYNLSFTPSLNAEWRYFPFDTHTISDLYREATFSANEFFSWYQLDGKRENIKLEPSLHFSKGRCFTLKPKVSTDLPVNSKCWTG